MAEAADIAKAGSFGALRSGLARPRNPRVAAGMLSAFRKWGTTPALGFALGAVRDPESIAIVDVDDPMAEEVTFAEAEYRTTVLANSQSWISVVTSCAAHAAATCSAFAPVLR